MKSVMTPLVVAFLICLVANTDAVRAEELHVAQSKRSPNLGKVQPMSDEHFWALIDSTAAFENDPERQIVALHSALGMLSTDDILAFEAAFGRQLRRSYSWDLWGAAYVVHGGASDDGFEYFQRWLISKGHRIFEQVVTDPDSLADVLAPDPGGPLEFESFAYVARRVWSEKTGLKAGEIPGGGAGMIYIDLQPSGTKFREDAAYLSQRYPKLWRRFGTNPLY